MKTPAFFKLSAKEQVALLAVTIDSTCMKRYKAGDVLPRGHECSTPDAVNKIQEFRQRSAENKARTILKVISV